MKLVLLLLLAVCNVEVGSGPASELRIVLASASDPDLAVHLTLARDLRRLPYPLTCIASLPGSRAQFRLELR